MAFCRKFITKEELSRVKISEGEMLSIEQMYEGEHKMIVPYDKDIISQLFDLGYKRIRISVCEPKKSCASFRKDKNNKVQFHADTRISLFDKVFEFIETEKTK